MTEPTKRPNEVIASNIVAGVEVARFDDTAYLTVEDLKTKIREQLDDKDSRIAQLLATAKEMLDLLSKTPNGPLWPNEEEFSRDFVRWSQRIAQASPVPSK